MFAKVLVLALALHMATCTSMIISRHSGHMRMPTPTSTSTMMPTSTSTTMPTPTSTSTTMPTPTSTSTAMPTSTSTTMPTPTSTSTAMPTSTSTTMPTPTSTSTTMPTTMAKPTVSRYPSRGVIEFLNCPDVIHEGIFIEGRKISNLENSCKLQAKSIIIEDSIFPVEGKTIYLIANHVKFLSTTFVGNNYSIRIVAEKIELISNHFVGDNSTYEVLGISTVSFENNHIGDNLSYKVLGSSIVEQSNVFTGNEQHHNLTIVDIQQIRNEYFEDLPIYNRVGFGTENPDKASDKSRYIQRQNCIFRGNRQILDINAPFFCNYDNLFSGDNIVLRAHGGECKRVTHGYVHPNNIFKFRGIEYDVL